jgi:hypothetical protein
LVAQAAAAQYPHRHEGLYASVGVGYGSADVSCDQCGDASRAGDLTGSLNVGGALSQSILLGLEVTGWSKVTSSNDNRSMGTVNGVLTWYPSTREGFFVKGGVGWGYLYGDQATQSSGIVSLSEGGVGYQLGLGYDIRLQRDLSVTAIAQFIGGNIGSVGSFNNVKFNVLQFMGAVTFH